jgi:hypothetical protein
MRGFVIRTPYKVLLGLSSLGGWDGWGITHAWEEGKCIEFSGRT